MAGHQGSRRARGVSPSNRGETGDNFALPASGGQLDTVGIAFAVHSDFQRQGATARVSDLNGPAEAWRYQHALPGGGFLALGLSDKGWLEASLPKRLDGENVSALDVGPALEVLRDAYEEAQTLCTVDRARNGHRFELAKVIRLDPVRDFDHVGHIPELLDGLAMVPARDKRHKVRRFADSERNAAESLRVGPKGWGNQLYDKRAETQGRAPEGRVRMEGRLHNEQLRSEWAKRQRVVMGQVGDVTTEKVDRLARALFERSAFDREVSGVATAADRVFGLDGVSPREQAMLWAFLTAPGFAADLGKDSRRKYRLLAEDVGLVVGQVLDADSPPVMVRLDYDRGTEVLRAA